MRCNQVSIIIEGFGEHVPENYPANVQRINVYCDDFNSIYVALSKAYALAINELGQHEQIGVRTDVYTNEFSVSDSREMRGALPEIKSKYEDEVELQYFDADIQLCEDRIWVYENAEKIFQVVRECTDQDALSARLKDIFGLDNYQICKLSQMRFDMLTKEEYEKAKEKIKQKKQTLSNKDSQKAYRKEQKYRDEFQRKS